MNLSAHTIFFFVLLSMPLVTSCNKSNFSTSDSLPQKTNSSSDAVSSHTTQNFAVKKDSISKQLPLRMLWLIDNSISMYDDVSAVQNGINDFINSITTSTYKDVQLTFVSCFDSNPPDKACVDSSLLTHSTITTVEQEIGSLNDLEIA